MQDHQALKTIRTEIKSIKDRIILRTKIQLPENLQHAQEALRGVMQDSVDARALKHKLIAAAETLSRSYFNPD